MQCVAGELHLETAFLSPGPGSDYTAVFFTGTKRIPLCGHDTIAAVTVLVHLGRLRPPGTVRLATDVGLLDVRVSETGDVTMAQCPPQYGSIVPHAVIAAVLGLPVSTLSEPGLPAQVVSSGTPFLLFPVQSRNLLNSLSPDMTKLGAFLTDLPGAVEGLYAWTRETVRPEAAVHARCFCPNAGLPEDPVTGTASGALGAYFVRHAVFPRDAEGVLKFQTEQGYAMGRPGNVNVIVQAQGEAVTGVWVQGRAVLAAEGELFI